MENEPKYHGFCSCILERSNKAIFVNPALTKVTGAYYKDHLKKQMLPACRKLYPANDFYYINGGARSHISKTVQLLEIDVALLPRTNGHPNPQT